MSLRVVLELSTSVIEEDATTRMQMLCPCEGLPSGEDDIGVSVFGIDNESVEKLLTIEPVSPDLTSMECSLGAEQDHS